MRPQSCLAGLFKQHLRSLMADVGTRSVCQQKGQAWLAPAVGGSLGEVCHLEASGLFLSSAHSAHIHFSARNRSHRMIAASPWTWAEKMVWAKSPWWNWGSTDLEQLLLESVLAAFKTVYKHNPEWRDWSRIVGNPHKNGVEMHQNTQLEGEDLQRSQWREGYYDSASWGDMLWDQALALSCVYMAEAVVTLWKTSFPLQKAEWWNGGEIGR